MKIEIGSVVELSDGRKGKVTEIGHSTFKVFTGFYFFSGKPLFETRDSVTVEKVLPIKDYPEEYLWTQNQKN